MVLIPASTQTVHSVALCRSSGPAKQNVERSLSALIVLPERTLLLMNNRAGPKNSAARPSLGARPLNGTKETA